MKNTIIFKIALPKNVFKISFLNSVLLNQQFNTLFIRQYNFSTELENTDFLRTQYISYSFDVVIKKLTFLLENHDFFCEASGNDSYFWITKLNNTIIYSTILPYNDFLCNQKNIDSLINNLFIEGAMSAYICSLHDSWWYPEPISEPTLFLYRRLQHSRYNNANYSKEQLSNVFLSDEIWQPVCWNVWVNCLYLQEYSCIRHSPYLYKFIQLSENIYHFLLHKKVQDYKLNSRKWLLDFLDIHLPLNDPTTIDQTLIKTEASFQLIQFYDCENNLTTKDSAIYQEISTFLCIDQSTGKLLSRKIYKL